MVQNTNDMTISFGADFSEYRAGIEEITQLGRNFGSALGQAFEDVAIRGRSLSDAFKGLALSLARSSLRSATNSFSGLLSENFGTLFAGAGSSLAGALPSILPFARGGVFSSPTLTPLNGPRLGVIGEAGPEAVLPLTRGSDGRLGVRNEGAAGGGGNITINISTPDVPGFARAESQVAAMVARAVDRGRRNL